MMKRSALVLLVGALLLQGTPALAASFLGGDTVSLAAPVSDDLYVSGSTVSVRQDVHGDLFALGGKLDVQNRVTGGVNVAGGNVTIVSQVGNDVRVLAGEAVIRGTINGDLLAGGGTVTVGSDAVVMGDAIVRGGNLILRGTVGKNLSIDGSAVSLEGIFHGDVTVHAHAVTIAGPVEGNATIIADTITLVHGAAFRGSVDYWSAEPTDFGVGLAEGQTATFHPEYAELSHGQRVALTGGFLAAVVGTFALFKLLSAALIIGLLVYITKTFFVDSAKYLRRHPGMSFLTGLGFFLLVPLAVLLLLITVFGIPLALLLLASYIFTLVFSVPTSAVVLARWAELHFKKTWNRWKVFGISFGIFIVLKLLTFLPVIGWVVKGVTVLCVLGALLMVKWVKLKRIL